MSLNKLKVEKSKILLQLEELKSQNQSRTKIRKLANKAASYENDIATILLEDGRTKNAIVNFISQASCLVDAGRIAEANRIYKRILQLTTEPRLKEWVNYEIEKLPTISFHIDIFSSINANITDNQALRIPQRCAYIEAFKHFNKSKEHAIIQLPVGCGKTGAMSILPFGISNGRVLVIAPNLEIRRNLRKNLDYANPDNFWKKTGVISNGSWPTTAELYSEANVHDCDEANILVTNIQQLASRKRSWLKQLSHDYFDLILIDEGHHAPASSWQKTLEHFRSAKVASFTATPLRSDGKRIEGERIYRYPLKKAIKEGFVKDIASRRLEPSDIYFTYRGEEHRHTLEEVMSLREEDWFSRGVALSRECNEHIVDASIQSMNELRSQGSTSHQIIAAACSIDHAKSIRSLYEERNCKAVVIHSRLEAQEQQDILNKLAKQEIDAIVQVAMLGEGADYPTLSVSAIFRPFRHVVPYVQFIGRVMRVIKQQSPGHVDNRAYIISHLGLNVDRWWNELKLFDEDEQEIYCELAEGIREFTFQTEDDKKKRRRFRPEMRVIEETLEQVVEKTFLDREDRQALIDELLSAIELRGIDPSNIGVTREMLEKELEKKIGNDETIHPFVKLPVQRQEERRQARSRLNERIRSAAKQLLNELDLSVPGYELPRKYTHLQARNNIGAAVILVNIEVNKRLNVDSEDRQNLSTDELRKAHDEIDDIIDALADSIRKSLEEK